MLIYDTGPGVARRRALTLNSAVLKIAEVPSMRASLWIALSTVLWAVLVAATGAGADSRDPYACSLLTDEEVAKTFGTPAAKHRVATLTGPADGSSECVFDPIGAPADNMLQLSVLFVPTADAAAAKTAFVNKVQDMIVDRQGLDDVKGLGDEAVAYTFGGLNITVTRKGDNVLTVGASGVARDPVIDAATLAVGRLKN